MESKEGINLEIAQIIDGLEEFTEKEKESDEDEEIN
jgi:hypothetical protein